MLRSGWHKSPIQGLWSDGRNTGVKTAEVLGIVFGVILSCASLRNVTSLGRKLVQRAILKTCTVLYFVNIYPFFFLPCFHLYISAYSSYRNFLSLLCAHCAICYAVVLPCLCVCVCAYICTCVHQSPPTVPLNYTGKRR